MSKADTNITTLDDAPDAPVAEVKQTKAELAKAAKAEAAALAEQDADAQEDEFVMLTIHAGEGEMGKAGVFVGANGEGILVPRGVPVKVRKIFADGLDNAKSIVYEPVGNQMVAREVHRYAFSVKPVPKGQ